VTGDGAGEPIAPKGDATDLRGLVMETGFPLVFAFAVIAGCTIGTGYIADQKGRSFALWAVIGFFLGIFGLLLAVVVPKKTPAY
jgi:hypothetical protein